MKKLGLLVAFLFGVAPLHAEDANKNAAPVNPAPPATATPPAAVSNFNEMTGSVMEIDREERLLRMTVENGVNVEFTFDSKTKVSNGGSPLKVEDLTYGDKIVVRYVGKELNASEIERLSKARNVIPESPAPESSPEAHPPGQPAGGGQYGQPLQPQGVGAPAATEDKGAPPADAPPPVENP